MTKDNAFEHVLDDLNASWLAEHVSDEIVSSWEPRNNFEGEFLENRPWCEGETAVMLQDQKERCWTVNRQYKPIKIDPKGGNMVAQIAPTIMSASARVPIDQWFDSGKRRPLHELDLAAGNAIHRLDSDIVHVEMLLLEAALDQKRDAVHAQWLNAGPCPSAGWKSMRMRPRIRVHMEDDGVHVSCVTTMAFLLWQSGAEDWWETPPSRWMTR